ncbi:hypothetical protein Gotur_012037, partial [Gossypium turneri]
MDTNDSLRVAGLWNSIHAISQQLSPTTGCSGIEYLKLIHFISINWRKLICRSDFPTRLTKSCRLGLVSHRLNLAMLAFTLSQSLKLRDENCWQCNTLYLMLVELFFMLQLEDRMI